MRLFRQLIHGDLIDLTIRRDDSVFAFLYVVHDIKYRHAAHCYLADQDYGTRLAAALSLDLNEVVRLSKLSNNDLNKETAVKK